MTPIVFGLSGIDLAVVGAAGVVAPLALRRRFGPWLVAAALAALALGQDRGSSIGVALALPWAVLAAATLVAVARGAGPVWGWTLEDLGRVVGAAWVVPASASLVVSRAGWAPLGIAEPIVELTAVHFTYVGAGAVALATAALASAGGRRQRRIGAVALVLTVGAPPLVATGFLLHAVATPAQVGGAVLLTVGVWCTGGLQLARALRRSERPTARILLAVSGLAIWVPMVLAVAWAAGEHWDVPALSIPDMVRTHGAANAVGFIGAGLLALRLERRSPRSDAPDPTDQEVPACR
jgi:hypothetical protein